MNGFDLLAPVYDALADFIFGSEVEKSQLYFLDKINHKHKVLIVGGGTGFILEKIEAGAEVTYLELSSSMIEKAKKRDVRCKVYFIQGTYTDVPQGEFDIIVTPFFLDLFTTERAMRIMDSLTQRLSNRGLWLFADFQHTVKIRHRMLLWLMYRFFRLVCGIEAKKLPDFSKVFIQGFLLEEEKSFYNGMISAKVLRKIK